MKKTSKSKKEKTESFDDKINHEFKFNVRLGPGKIETIEFTLIPPDEDYGHMTYDYVEFAAMDEMETKYPNEYYPKSEIDGYILIKDDADEWYPIVSDGDKEGIKSLKKSNEYNKFLILPDATYSLSPEYLLYMSMVKNGIIDEKKVSYDHDKMHSLLEEIDGKKYLKQKEKMIK